jgi:pimeloyl-ACP methyl ester carboxylesterase
VWTVDRYSSAVVNSMNAAANKLADQQRSSRIVLVGHSGGGTIAALMASSLPRTVAVVTIAANLDTDEWNHRHGYWPLYGSRNPANEPPLPASMTQLHLVGDRDKNVTFEMNARYFARVPADSIRHYTSFDHTHEWVWEWPHVRRRLTDTFDSSSR